MSVPEGHIKRLKIVFDGVPDAEKDIHGIYYYQDTELRLYVSKMQADANTVLENVYVNANPDESSNAQVVNNWLNSTLLHETAHFLSQTVIGRKPEGVDKVKSVLLGVGGLIDNVLSQKQQIIQDMHPLYAGFPGLSAIVLGSMHVAPIVFYKAGGKFYEHAYENSPEEKFAFEFDNINSDMSFITYTKKPQEQPSQIY